MLIIPYLTITRIDRNGIIKHSTGIMNYLIDNEI
jgi:hypothetical protein